MSAQPKLQNSTPVQPASRRPVRVVASSKCASMVMPKQEQPAKPTYDFVGIAG